MSDTPGVFARAHTALVALEETALPDLRVYPWQPRGRQIETPCVWNWLVPPEEQSGWRNQAVFRDIPIFRVSIVVNPSGDSQEEVGNLLDYVDRFVEVVDLALDQDHLGECATVATRLGMETAIYADALLAMDMPIAVQLDRKLR